MKNTINLILLLYFLNLNSQEIGFDWVNQIEGSSNEIITSQVDSNNNIYVSGIFDGGQFDDINGSITFNGIANSSITFLEMDGAFLAKYSNVGELEWAIPIYEIDSSINISSLKIDNNGNLYLTGRYSGTIAFDYESANIQLTSTDGGGDSFIAKFDNDGDLLWIRELKGNGGDSIVSISVSETDSNIYITGSFNQNLTFQGSTDQLMSNNNFNDVFIAKYNASGDYQWAKGFGDSNSDFALDILAVSNDDFYAFGNFSGTINIGDNTTPFTLTSDAFSDNYIAKFNQDGDPLWAKQIENNVTIEDTAIDSSDNIFITGTFSGNQDFDPDNTVFQIQSANNSSDAFLLKLDSNGSFNWAKSFGGSSADTGTALAIDANDIIFIGGWYSSSFDYLIDSEIVNLASNSGSFDCYILKFDTNGAPLDVVTFGGEETDILNALETKNNSIYAFGRYRETVDFDPTNGVFEVTITNSNPDANSYLLSLIDDTTLSVLDNSFVEEDIHVYPNPTSKFLNIKLDKQNYNLPLRMILRNSLGKIVQNRLLSEDTINQHYSISVDINSGIYFLELYEHGKLLKSTKFIKK